MHEKRMVATDMDGTFLGDDSAMVELWNQLLAKRITIVFSTGRHLQSIESFYEEKRFAGRADVCICMVGTDIYFRENQQYRLDATWHEHIRYRWNKSDVESILREIPEAAMQDSQWQSPYKSSYYLEENVARRLEQLKQRLSDAGLEAKIVYSADKFLDLLPIRSGKGEAVRYAANKLGFAPHQVIACGDTGNDLDMMRRELGFKGIAVGNATGELKAFKQPHVYHADAHYAAGILEGLHHHGWL